MGTAIVVELWCDERAAGEAAITAVMDEMHRIDRTMSPHKADSELSRINRDAGAGAGAGERRDGAPDRRAPPSSRALSGGAFDITYAAVGQLYDYRNRIRPSDDGARRGPARAVGWRHLVLDSQARHGALRAARHAHRPRRLRQGPRGRQRGGDPAPARHRATRWSAPAATAASSATGAAGPGRSACATRAGPGELAAMLPLEDVSISTSGDYERYFDADGTRFHHLIDPATGKSPRGIQSVTILADDGLTCEALSKIVFVLGVERGMALVETQSGVDAVVVDAAGALHFSSGLLAPPPPSSASTTQ